MSTFSTTALTGSKILVEGTDRRGYTDSQVVDSAQWDGIKRQHGFTAALGAVDDAIATLLAPIQAAVDNANAAIATPELDPMLYFVEQEAVPGVVGQQAIMAKLSTDSIILRALEEGKQDRLIWVNHELVLTAAPAPVAPAVYDDSVADAFVD